MIYKTAQEADAQEKFMPFQIVEIEAEDELMKEEVCIQLFEIWSLKNFYNSEKSPFFKIPYEHFLVLEVQIVIRTK